MFNPTSGPYAYSLFSFEFGLNGSPIDSTTSYQDWITVACGSNCLECEGSLTTCTSCGTNPETEASFYLSGSACLAECPAGQYGGVGYICEPCESPCLQCTIGPTLCTECDPTFGNPYADPLTLQCYSECPEGTYLSGTQCVKCESPCYTCLSATECLSCDRTDPTNLLINFFPEQQQCYETCPSISVPSPSKTCIACESPCLECEDLPDQCTSCIEGMYLYKSQCVSSCPFSMFKDEVTQTCQDIASLDVPFPFTITAILLTVGVGVSHCMKGSGDDQQGTAFFITMLACVDALLRINWCMLIWLGYD